MDGNWHEFCWIKNVGNDFDPKAAGGLGFKDFEAFNIALLAKQFWRLINSPNALWARVLKGLYFPNKAWTDAVRGSKPSWLWSSLLEGRKLIQEGTLWRLGNGESIQFWTDKWIPEITGGKLSAPSNIQSDTLTVSNFIDTATKCWNREKLNQCLPVEQADAVSKIPISLSGSTDKLIWKATSSGKYTVKSGYAHQVKSIPRLNPSNPSCSYTPSSRMWNKLWSIPTMPKIRMFMWKVTRNWMACRANLVKRKCGSNSLCPICESTSEKTEHLLFRCPWTRAVWFGSNRAFWVYHRDVVSVDKWIEDMLCGSLAKETCNEVVGEIFQLCWAIWKARNSFVFNRIPPDPKAVIDQALRANKDYLLAACTKVNSALPKPVGVTKWVPPPTSFIKINVDGAFISSRSSAAFGIIARDSGGSAQWWRCGSVKVASALSIEAWALRIACAMAKDEDLNEVIFESDCKNLIDYVTDAKLESPWIITAFVEDIRTWAKDRNWSFKWCNRNSNRVAHWIASNCRNRRVTFLSGCIPPDLHSILVKDLS